MSTTITYANSIVAFLDVLGFSQLAAKPDAEAVEAIRRLESALSHVEMEVREHSFWGRSLSARMFSAPSSSR